MAAFSDGEREVPLLPLSSGVCIYSFLPAYPAEPDCADTSKSDRLRPNFFYINFNRSRDCLFGFWRYIFHGLFPFLFGHYNQSGNRPLSRAFFQNVRNFPDVIDQRNPACFSNPALQQTIHPQIATKPRKGPNVRRRSITPAGARLRCDPRRRGQTQDVVIV